MQDNVGSLHTQNDLVHSRRMVIETYHTGQDQSRCLALRMRTRNWILGGMFPQMLLHLIHQLVGFGVLANPLMIWLRFIPQTKDALSGFAHQRKSIHPLLCQVPRRCVRFLLLDVIPGSTSSTLLSKQSAALASIAWIRWVSFACSVSPSACVHVKRTTAARSGR